MITRIQISGFKSIREQDIQLSAVNILLGGNGVGKSNFISIFTFIKNLYEGSLQQHIIQKGGADSFLHYGKKHTQEIKIGLEFKVDDEFRNRFMVDLGLAQDTLYIQRTRTAFFNGIWHYLNYEKDVNESNFRNISARQAWYVNDHLLDIEVYHFHDTGDTSPMKGLCSLNDNSKLRRNGSNLAAFLFLLQEKHPNHFRRIEETIKSVAPFFKQFVLAPNRLSSEQDPKIQIEWIDQDVEDVTFNSYHLSDGTLRFIALTTLLMQPSPPATIIIDEPELGLHPVAINKLAGLIRKASTKSQIIVSSQSVNLVNNFDPEDLILADRADNETVFKRPKAEELDKWLEEYSLGEVWEKKIIGGQPYKIKK